jgi:diguanylate cyclase (GGDEF)-like protein
MAKLNPLSPRTMQDIERHILYFSDFEHYYKSILAQLHKRLGTQSVFLILADRGKKLSQDTFVYGKDVPQNLLQNLGKRPAPDGLLCRNLILKGQTLGRVGAIVSPEAGITRRLRKDFVALSESLKKDFFFLRERALQKRRAAKLNTLYRISRIISETLDLDKLIASIVDMAKRILKSEAASLAIADHMHHELTFSVVRGAHGKKVSQQKMKFGQGIVGTVIDTGESMLIRDAGKDKRFFGGMDKTTGFKTRSILCVPMKVHNNIIGAIEVLNPTDRPSYTPDQIPLLATLAQEAAVSLENARLFRLATTDGLTGLGTIRYFKTLLEHEIPRCKRYGRDLSLFLLDIDFFKKINDTHGHLAGDLCLRELATLIHASIRQIDVSARYGGEEFIVMLPESSHKDALVVAERLREKVASAKVQDKGQSYSFTVSIGVSSMRDADTLEELIKRADQNLYKAKESGRNRVCGE